MDPDQRLEIYRRARRFREDPEAFRAGYADETAKLKQEIAAAREILPQVTIEGEAERFAINCIQRLAIPSHRAEIALFEAARARAAADFRLTATIEDVRRVALLALRQRRSVQIDEYAATVTLEDTAINQVVNGNGAPRRRSTRKKSHSAHPSDVTPPTLADGTHQDHSSER
jgi:magnesium chelatase subunit I